MQHMWVRSENSNAFIKHFCQMLHIWSCLPLISAEPLNNLRIVQISSFEWEILCSQKYYFNRSPILLTSFATLNLNLKLLFGLSTKRGSSFFIFLKINTFLTINVRKSFFSIISLFIKFLNKSNFLNNINKDNIYNNFFSVDFEECRDFEMFVTSYYIT